MKVIILGAPCSGKTTLLEKLRETKKFPIFEMDEELRRANNNAWPDDDNYRNEILLPTICEKILNSAETIFFTSYFPEKQLEQSIANGFKIIQLTCPIDVLLKRNSLRMKNDPTLEDESEGIKANVIYQEKLSDEGVINSSIDTNSSMDKSFKDLLSYLHSL